MYVYASVCGSRFVPGLQIYYCVAILFSMCIYNRLNNFFLFNLGWRPLGFVGNVEPARGVHDPSEGVGDRRGGMGRPASASARLLGYVGNRRRRPEGQPVHGHHVRHALPVAEHRLPHTGQYSTIVVRVNCDLQSSSPITTPFTAHPVHRIMGAYISYVMPSISIYRGS